MPLTQGKSKKAFDSNMSELMHKFHQTGRIGTSKPANAEKARKQALVIAFGIKGKQKGGK